jgi:hypothetical protein
LKHSITKRGWIEESTRLIESQSRHQDPLCGTIQDHDHNSNDRKCLETKPVIKTGDRCLKRSSQVKRCLPYGRSSRQQLQQSTSTFSPTRASGRLNECHKSIFTCHAYYLFDFLFDPSEKSIELTPHNKFLHIVQFKAHETHAQDYHLSRRRSKQKKTTTKSSPGRHMDQYQSYATFDSASLYIYRYISTTSKLPQCLCC